MSDVSASALSPGAGRADWLRGPGFDLALLVGVPAMALGLGGLVVARPSLFVPVLLFDVWVLAYPHVTSTFTRIAFDRASARRHWFLLAGLPWLVIAGTAAVTAVGGVGGLFTAYYVGQTYHYTRQSYGLARVYARRAGATPDRLSDAVVYAFPVWGLLQRAHEGHRVFYDQALYLPRVPGAVATAAGVGACGLLALWAAREARGLAGRPGHALFVVSHVVVTAVSYLVIDDITSGWLVVNLWHNAQYLLFVWGVNAARFRGGPDAQSPFLSRLCQPRNVWAYALFCVGFAVALYGVIDRVGERLPVGVFPLVLVLHLSVNFHHYLVDGIIWKSRRPSPAAG